MSARGLRARVARILLAVVVVFALVFAWALADMPQLYAASFYAQGGVLRAIQLLCTDVLGPRGVIALGLGLALVLVARQVRPLLAKARRVRMSAPALLAVLGVGHAELPPASDDRPNILVLAADGLGADLDPRTVPNVARLGAVSTRFDRAYVASSPGGLDPVAVRLEREGYRTAAVTDAADPALGRPPLLVALAAHVGGTIFPDLRALMIADPALVAADVATTLDQVAGRPFFVTATFSTSRPAHATRAPFYRRFTDRAYRGRFKYDVAPDGGRVDDADRAQILGLRDGEASSVDDAIGRVLASLEARRLDRRTIVVVTGLRGAPGPSPGEALHVPLVIHDPRAPTPRRSAQIVRDVDLAPTLLELAGLAAGSPGDPEARSLAPALRGEVLAPRLAYGGSMADSPLAQRRSVRDERWELGYLPERAGVRYVLFDTEHDPGETTDVAADHPAEVTRLTAALWRWMLEDPAMEARDGYLVPRAAPAPYDVLWIAVPTLSPGPVLDALARRGTRFTSAYATGRLRADAAQLQRHGVTLRVFEDLDGAATDALEKALDAERTIVVVTAEHGTTSTPSHAGGNFEEATRVPTFLLGPGFAPGATVDARCRTEDLAPTVLDVLGIEPAAGTRGRSLLRLGREREPRVVVTEVPGSRAILHEHWRLVAREGGRTELFDLAADPGERSDVARAHPEVVAELQARLAAALVDAPTADARTTEERPPAIRLRFVGGPGSHRIVGTILAKDAAITPVDLGRDAVHRDGERIDVAFRTDDTIAVGFDLVAAEATWDFWLDDVPLRDVFGGAWGLRAPALEHGVVGEPARAAAAAAALPAIDPRADRGLFVVRGRPR